MNAIKECVAESRQTDSVKRFIKAYRKCLNKNQIQLLNLMEKKIYGFYFHSQEYHSNNYDSIASFKNIARTALFKFHNDGIDGQITIRF